MTKVFCMIIALCVMVQFANGQYLETTIPGLRGPLGYNLSYNKIYARSPNDSSIFVINGATNSIVDSIVGVFPAYCWGYNSLNSKVYCGSYFATMHDSLVIIDGELDTVITTIDIGPDPKAMDYSPVNNRIYLATGGDVIKVIDGMTNVVITSVSVGDLPADLVYDTADNRIYCANHNSGDISVLDCATNAVITTISAGLGPQAVTYNSNDNKVYCANNWGNTVTVIDASSNTVIVNIPVGSSPYDLAFNNVNDKIYCANQGENNVTVIDGATNAVITAVPTGNGPVALTYDTTNNKIYCANSGTVTIIDGGSNNVITTIPVGGYPYSFVWNPFQNRVYVGKNGPPVAVIRDTTTGIVESLRGVVEDDIVILCPNPFSRKINIRLQITNSKTTSISIYNTAGRLVKTILSRGTYSTGPFTVSWDGTNDAGLKLPGGVYFLRCKAEGFDTRKKAIMLKQGENNE